MIDAESLRAALKQILGIPDKYLVPLSNTEFEPTVDDDEKIGTWIGYRILTKERFTRAFQGGLTHAVPVRVKFRITFMGPGSEELIDQCLLWDDRKDVQEAFETCCNAQLNYNERFMYTQSVKNEGFNDGPVWVVDMTAQSFYEVTTDQKPWFWPRPNISIQ